MTFSCTENPHHFAVFTGHSHASVVGVVIAIHPEGGALVERAELSSIVPAVVRNGVGKGRDEHNLPINHITESHTLVWGVVFWLDTALGCAVHPCEGESAPEGR